MSSVFQHLLESLYPPLCPLCLCEELQKGELIPICPSCSRQIGLCGLQEAWLPLKAETALPHWQFPAATHVLQASRYQPPLSTAVVRLKFSEGWEQLGWMSRLLALAYQQQENEWEAGLLPVVNNWERGRLQYKEMRLQKGDKLLWPCVETALGWRARKPDAILPLPLHARRLGQRGYNQAAELAKGFAKEVGLPCREDLLLRRRYTLRQTDQLDRESRRWNVSQAFVCPKKEEIHGRFFLLLDDVVTTGSSLQEARQALLAAGAAEVVLMALAGH